MKTIFKLVTTALLINVAVKSNAQTYSICTGQSTVVTAMNSQSLTNPTYSINPGGITSVNPTFTVNPNNSTTYTLYVTGTNSNSALVTISHTVNVIVNGVTFSVVSPQNYTLGCNTKSVCALQIINASSTPIPGSNITFTFLTPGSSTVIPPGNLGTNSNTNVIVPGNWWAAARDNATGCTAFQNVNIQTNTVAPILNAVSVPTNVLSCNTSSVILQTAQNPNETYKWMPMNVIGNTITVSTNTVAPTQTLITTLTLQATNLDNTCMTFTAIPMLQNIFPPIASIHDGNPSTSCQNSITLTNMSSTSIPPISGFPANQPIAGFLWEGPAPQVSLSLSTTYLAQTSGVYTMTAKDMNNGCIKTATINVALNGITAAFAHTVIGAQVDFNNASINVAPGATYFWNFGDGHTSTLQNPSHSYLSGGSHPVKFKVSTGPFCSDSVVQSVNVTGVSCLANSGFAIAATPTAQIWNVIPTYPWNVSAATWDWGDGSSSNTLYTSHQYSTAGMYNICLSVTVNCVASSSTCSSYSVYRSSQPEKIIGINVTAPTLILGLSSIDTQEQLNWRIFPNPNKGEFSLRLENTKSESVNVTITDLSGRIVYNDETTNTTETISINAAHLPQGLYFITIEAGYIKTTKRFVVNK